MSPPPEPLWKRALARRKRDEAGRRGLELARERLRKARAERPEAYRKKDGTRVPS